MWLLEDLRCKAPSRFMLFADKGKMFKYIDNLSLIEYSVMWISRVVK